VVAAANSALVLKGTIFLPHCSGNIPVGELKPYFPVFIGGLCLDFPSTANVT